MVPLGSKALIALGVVTLLAGAAMGTVNGDKTATLVLCAVGGAAILIAIAVAIADSDRPPYVAPDAPFADQSPTGGRPARPSVWPIGAALGFALLALATATNAVVMLGAVVVLLIAGTAWLLQTWAEHPTYTSSFATRLRERVLLPFGIPAAVIILVGTIALGLSRVFLTLPENGTRAVALAVAVVIIVGGFVVASAERIARTAMVLLTVFALAAVVAAGIVSFDNGMRKPEENHLVTHFVPAPGEPAPTTTVPGETSSTVPGATTTTVQGANNGVPGPTTTSIVVPNTPSAPASVPTTLGPTIPPTTVNP